MLLFDLLDSPVGTLLGIIYLFVRYRSRKRVKEVLQKEYAGSYANVGSVLILNTIAAVGALTMVLFLLIVVWSAYKFGIH